MSETQSASSHAKMVPMYHYLTFVCVLLPTVYFAVQAVRDFSVGAVMMVVFGVGVILSTLFARIFPLGVQDRVIRLEERIRMERVLPAEMHGRLGDVSTSHLIGLRFAPDDELADLVQRILDGELSDRKSVKQAIRSWRADHQRI